MTIEKSLVQVNELCSCSVQFPLKITDISRRLKISSSRNCVFFLLPAGTRVKRLCERLHVSSGYIIFVKRLRVLQKEIMKSCDLISNPP